MQLIKQNKKGFQLLLIFFIGTLIWLAPMPEGVDPQGWKLFAIFVATIVGVILKPLPMGAIALFSLTITVFTKILSFNEAFSGFAHPIVWLIVVAFFIARGFIITGLGNRVAYFFMSILGQSSLGLSYGLIATEFILSPAIPSLTARTGGVIFPILKSLASAFGSEPNNASSRKLGSFLIMCSFQGAMITSAMFLTSMAGNPLVAELALKNIGVEITWGGWAIAAIVPGLLSLIIMPYVIYKIYPPGVKKTPDAKAYSKKKLKELGSLKPKEWIMLGTFIFLIVLWTIGPHIGLKATVAALLGLFILVLTGILDWKELLKEGGAWDTLIWFATLITLAGYLNDYGLTKWFSQFIVVYVQDFNWVIGFGILSIIYFYTHYFFASNLAHIGAMYAPFVIIAVALGTPPMIAALVLAFFSSLFGGITHYGCGPAPILYGAGYVAITDWWKLGAIISILNIIIWLGVGSIWWKVLGLW